MRYSALTLLPLLASASPVVNVGTIHNDAAPVLSSTTAEEVPNGYMVVFKKHVKHTDASEHHSWVQQIHSKGEQQRMELRKRSNLPITADIIDGLKHTYNIAGGIMGYSGSFDDETIEQIRRHPDVSLPSYSRVQLRPIVRRRRARRAAACGYAIARDS
jgi:cerevisin